MPDVIELLNNDHREVEQLFTEYESTRDYEVAMQICDELLMHATCEEEIVYPPLERIDVQLEREAEQEHLEAEQLIDQIQALEPGDSQFPALMTKLKEAVMHHVEEEETEAWPKMRERYGDKLDELGTMVMRRKEELKAELAGSDTETGGTPSPTPTTSGTTTQLLDLTKEELYAKAKEAEIRGRSDMTKQQLAEALANR